MIVERLRSTSYSTAVPSPGPALAADPLQQAIAATWGSTVEPAFVVWLSGAVAKRARQVEAGPRSAAKKQQSYAAAVDAALAAVLLVPPFAGSKYLPHTADLLRKKMRNHGPVKLGLTAVPSPKAMREALWRHASKIDEGGR